MAGCLLKREGASHSIWINPATGVKEAVPRHNEITGAGLVGSRRVLGGSAGRGSTTAGLEPDFGAGPSASVASGGPSIRPWMCSGRPAPGARS